MNDPYQTITWSGGDDLVGRLGTGDTTADEDRPPTAAGLVSLGFFTDALRRGARVWCLTAVLGLALGAGLYLKYPPAYHAATTVLLVYSNPEGSPEIEVQTEQTVAQSRTVAERVVQQLKLPESAASFQKTYTVTIVTDNVLTINVGAPIQCRSGAASIGPGHSLPPSTVLRTRGPRSGYCSPSSISSTLRLSNASMRLMRRSTRYRSFRAAHARAEGRVRQPADPD